MGPVPEEVVLTEPERPEELQSSSVIISVIISVMLLWKQNPVEPLPVVLEAGRSTEALREEAAELQDARLQLVGADGRHGNGERGAGRLGPPPPRATSTTEPEVTPEVRGHIRASGTASESSMLRCDWPGCVRGSGLC